MDNKFFKFLETYKDDIKAFFDAFVAFVKTIIGKLGEGEEETTEPTA